MVMSPAGLLPEKHCTGETQQQLKSTEPSSRQRGQLTSTDPLLSKDKEKGKFGCRAQMGF
jgi:hypothetical protein